MKKNIIKLFILFVVLGAGGWLYWYYDFNGGMGASVQVDEQATVDIPSGLSDPPLAAASLPVVASDPTAVSVGTSTDVNVPEAIDESSPIATSDATSSVEDSPADPTVPAIPPSPTPQACSLSDVSGDPSRSIILNEIAWMGSLPNASETAAKAGAREWIELKNISSGTIDLSGWQIFGGSNLKIVVTSTEELKPGRFFLFVRAGEPISVSGGAVSADEGYSGGLSNAGEKLTLVDPNCNVSDLLDATTGWPGGNNTTKQTLERDADGVGWHTSAMPGGTPDTENSTPPPVTPALMAAKPSQYSVAVSLPGAGMGVVSSSPAGILCGSQCVANYASGTMLNFAAIPTSGSFFAGWSGICNSTTTTCSFIIASSETLSADFENIPTQIATIISPGAPGSPSNPSSTPVSGGAAGHLLIAQIQIAGASSSNDFVKIFNPTSAAIDLSGWKLHKKSNTGTDYSLKTFITGNTIAPNGYFTWANSEGGFADAIGADASSTETLSADNSIALFDASGAIVDQVAWGTGTDQYVEGSAYPTDPAVNQILERTMANSVMVDTDDNAVDFVTSLAMRAKLSWVA